MGVLIALEPMAWPLLAVPLLDLARLIARDRQPAEALFLLDQLERKVEESGDREHLRAIRARLWWIEPSLRHSWRWLVLAIEARSQRRASVAC